MCIIAIKQPGTPIDMEILGNCFDTNPHGAGFTFRNGESLEIVKGLLTWDAFTQALEQFEIEDKQSERVMFHFRIATHGGQSEAYTHPFPLSQSLKMLKSTYCSTDIAVAHNGIILNGAKTSTGLSDTAKFIKECLYPLGSNIMSPLMEPIIEQASDSKLAFMTKDEIAYVGAFVDDGGWTFSNDTYSSSWYSQYSAPGWKVEGTEIGYCDMCGEDFPVKSLAPIGTDYFVCTPCEEDSAEGLEEEDAAEGMEELVSAIWRNRWEEYVNSDNHHDIEKAMALESETEFYRATNTVKGDGSV